MSEFLIGMAAEFDQERNGIALVVRRRRRRGRRRRGALPTSIARRTFDWTCRQEIRIHLSEQSVDRRILISTNVQMKKKHRTFASPRRRRGIHFHCGMQQEIDAKNKCWSSIINEKLDAFFSRFATREDRVWSGNLSFASKNKFCPSTNSNIETILFEKSRLLIEEI